MKKTISALLFAAALTTACEPTDTTFKYTGKISDLPEPVRESVIRLSNTAPYPTENKVRITENRFGGHYFKFTKSPSQSEAFGGHTVTYEVGITDFDHNGIDSNDQVIISEVHSTLYTKEKTETIFITPEGVTFESDRTSKYVSNKDADKEPGAAIAQKKKARMLPDLQNAVADLEHMIAPY